MRRLLHILLCCSLVSAQTTVFPKMTVFPKTTLITGGVSVALLHVSLCSNISSGQNCTLTFTTGTGHGLFVLLQSGTAAGTVTAITDGGDAFTEVPSSAVYCQSQLNDIWYTPSTGGARTTFNVTTSGGTSYYLAVYEAANTNASSPLDQHATASSTGTNTAGAPVTTTSASELVISTETVAGSVSAVTSPFTFDSNQFAGGWASVVTTTTGTYTPNWTNTGAGANCGTTASFKP